MTHSFAPRTRKRAFGMTDEPWRISIGAEHANNIIADFALAGDAA